MITSLTDQKSVIIGGASGIGRAISEAFLEAESEVAVLDRDVEKLDILRADHPEMECIQADVADYHGLTKAAEGREIDHLIVAAAIGSGKPAMPFWKMIPTDWDHVIDVTLLGTIRSVHAFSPGLLRGNTKKKSVLLLSSVAGQIGSQTDPPYSASKAAVINFAQCAAKDFAPHGIRVNTIAPGMVRTELNKAVFEASKGDQENDYDQWADEKIARISPLARWQEASEIGAMSVFLASDFGRNITGQTLNIDGGQVMHS